MRCSLFSTVSYHGNCQSSGSLEALVSLWFGLCSDDLPLHPVAWQWAKQLLDGSAEVMEDKTVDVKSVKLTRGLLVYDSRRIFTLLWLLSDPVWSCTGWHILICQTSLQLSIGGLDINSTVVAQCISLLLHPPSDCLSAIHEWLWNVAFLVKSTSIHPSSDGEILCFFFAKSDPTPGPPNSPANHRRIRACVQKGYKPHIHQRDDCDGHTDWWMNDEWRVTCHGHIPPSTFCPPTTTIRIERQPHPFILNPYTASGYLRHEKSLNGFLIVEGTSAEHHQPAWQQECRGLLLEASSCTLCVTRNKLLFGKNEQTRSIECHPLIVPLLLSPSTATASCRSLGDRRVQYAADDD